MDSSVLPYQCSSWIHQTFHQDFLQQQPLVGQKMLGQGKANKLQSHSPSNKMKFKITEVAWFTQYILPFLFSMIQNIHEQHVLSQCMFQRRGHQPCQQCWRSQQCCHSCSPAYGAEQFCNIITTLTNHSCNLFIPCEADYREDIEFEQVHVHIKIDVLPSSSLTPPSIVDEDIQLPKLVQNRLEAALVTGGVTHVHGKNHHIRF